MSPFTVLLAPLVLSTADCTPHGARGIGRRERGSVFPTEVILYYIKENILIVREHWYEAGNTQG